jgi:hypothetical protein
MQQAQQCSSVSCLPCWQQHRSRVAEADTPLCASWRCVLRRLLCLLCCAAQRSVAPLLPASRCAHCSRPTVRSKGSAVLVALPWMLLASGGAGASSSLRHTCHVCTGLQRRLAASHCSSRSVCGQLGGLQSACDVATVAIRPASGVTTCPAVKAPGRPASVGWARQPMCKVCTFRYSTIFHW